MFLKDTLTRQIKELSREKPFGFYCCGPTVYGPAHIGNFRTFILQDVLRRALELAGYAPVHVRNITDVDDKTILRSQQAGLSLKKFTEQWTQRFLDDCNKLNLLSPHQQPRATDHIVQQIQLIQKLIERGLAYVENGSVYFRVAAYKDYGKLTQLSPENLRTQSTNSAGHVNDVDEYDRDNVRDFALWKAHKADDGDVFWESPWGKGRPGWHIECSAMSMHYLGETFNLHGGGIDLIFPHHENEIAQSEGATGKPFVRHWFHTTHLTVDGKKMSKSLGNLYTLEDLEKQGFSTDSVRYLLLSGHYSQPLNFTLDSLGAAQSALSRIEKFAHKLLEHTRTELSQINTSPTFPFTQWNVFKPTWEAIQNDMNTPQALGELFSSLPQVDLDTPGLIHEFRALLFLFGFKMAAPQSAPEAVLQLAHQRWQAKQAKDFALADSLRAQIQSLGWQMLDGKDSFNLVKL
ncbi:MAG: cysteine--tRNA ligase [Verrucomicrobia bacterium GWF2_51_19]|nr:MAG: cysteine--tRNA ligase [Verrucomicrobia bacterium GWF2_51_19]HCJ11783.1 cysteine--tRNA ligase [Opitutae bacterium]